MATCGSLCPIRLIIDRKQSFAFFEFDPALSHISIITSHCSDVFVSLVAFSVDKIQKYSRKKTVIKFYKNKESRKKGTMNI